MKLRAEEDRSMSLEASPDDDGGDEGDDFGDVDPPLNQRSPAMTAG